MRRIAFFILAACLALPPAARADRIEKQVSVTAGQQLDIDLESGGAITIRGGDDRTASFTVDREGRDAAETEVTIEATSGGGARIATRHVGRRDSYSTNLRIDIRLPQRFSVHLKSMGGSVHLAGLDGKFEGTTMGGDLELSELNGEAHLKTMGGDVRVSKSKLDGRITTMGGKVQLEDIEGNLQGHSMGGTVTYQNVRGGKEGSRGDSSRGAVVMSSMGGDLRVEDAPAGAELRTMGGNVRVRSAAKYVKATTMGGDIEIDRVDGRVDATSMAGDIKVTLVEGSGGSAAEPHDVKLDSKSGELHLAVPADLAMDIDIQLFYTRASRRNYRVHSDFPLKIEESSEWDTTHGSPRKLIHATGRQGAATHRIELSCINGDVYLTRAQ
ncbi:MAG TPA: DUF4097 family beta strand repeat-containing protein [Thermoanaerobaculia bacterium]|nr:DUF4097 family beta strand repeat-containing protein [Thermoanaerobaculia bacterium]